MRILYTLLLLLVPFADACWWDQKGKAIRHIRNYMHRIKRDPEKGLDHNDFQDIINDLPGGIRWVVKKVGSIDGIFHRCDSNRDGLIKVSEAEHAHNCMSDCYKQVAIINFL